MNFLLGRFEKNAEEFYREYTENNRFFKNEAIKSMSKLTENLLRGIDYERVRSIRTENFALIDSRLKKINKLTVTVPEGAYMYPFYIDNGAEVRKKLQEKKIYIPTLWPAVFNRCTEDEPEYDMAENILPLPVDQRYGSKDMEYLCDEVINTAEGE